MKQKHAFFLGASLPRALSETWLLGMGALLGLMTQHAQLSNRALGQTIFFIMPIVAFWYAIRLRMPSSLIAWRQLVYEAGGALLLSPLGAGLWLAIFGAFGLYPVLASTQFGTFGAVLLILAVSPFAVAFRIAARAWLFWEGLRRRRLVWALTHTQLQLVLVFVVLVGVATTLSLIAPGNRSFFDLDTWVFTFLPFLGLGTAFTFVSIGIVLPPALLLGWLTARRTTRRLEMLTNATAALREGDYATRVPVQGEDEVAQLQSDFNAMAQALEQAMADLQAERDKVAKLLDARRELVASVSHELRTPLATVRGYLESVQDAPEAQSLQHDLAVMEKELNRLQRLIDDLFTLSRAEVDGLTLTLAPVDLGDLIRGRVGSIGPLAWQRERLQVVAEVPNALPKVMTDAARLEQVLTNLLRNAIRHTPPGGVIAVSAEVDGDHVCLRVCDTGEGIPPAELPHIWERFYRGAGSLSRDTQGAGLGLALVKELTEAMGGRASVESTVNAGSCFMVWLPQAKASGTASGLTDASGCSLPLLESDS